MAKCLCRGCNEIFSSASSFDKHRTGSYGEPIYKKSSTGKSETVISYTKSERRCMTTEEMLAIGMMRNQRGWWITSAFSWDTTKAEDTEEDESEDAEEEESEEEEVS